MQLREFKSDYKSEIFKNWLIDMHHGKEMSFNKKFFLKCWKLFWTLTPYWQLTFCRKIKNHLLKGMWFHQDCVSSYRFLKILALNFWHEKNNWNFLWAYANIVAMPKVIPSIFWKPFVYIWNISINNSIRKAYFSFSQENEIRTWKIFFFLLQT